MIRTVRLVFTGLVLAGLALSLRVALKDLHELLGDADRVVCF